MCGIVGAISLSGAPLPRFDRDAALRSLYHRGPDEGGEYVAKGIFLGTRRLAIIDPAHGQQPVKNENGRYHLAMNGEIYDYDLLLEKLLAGGHTVHSHCDTEVAVHLFEDRWAGALDVIDGQFALAAYDQAEHKLLIARDRMGICPLFYAQVGDTLIFASEAKALFATGLIAPRINPRAMDAILSMGCVPAPWSMYEGVRALAPGRYLEIHDGGTREKVYWDIPYPDAGDYPKRSGQDWADQLLEALQYAAKRRLKADVPVGMYLSGGIDSATIASLVADSDDIHSRVFSIGFPEPGFDESAKTQRIAHALGLEAQFLTYEQSHLAEDLPKLLQTCETPMVSTESVPLMALSGMASEHGKVVLTGEGSDEALGGYRFFCWEAFQQKFGRLISGFVGRLKQPQLGVMNPMVPTRADRDWADNAFGFYPASMMKFRYMRMVRDHVYTPDMLARCNARDDREFTSILPREAMQRWDPLNRSLYVSSRIFMAHHLLGPHGDRALMTNSVEGRYPFLDRRVQELLATVPPKFKTKWNKDKALLRRAMAGRLPKEVLKRKKQPFLAPFGTPFVGDSATDEIRDLLTPRMLKSYGYFDAKKVASLVTAMETHADANTGHKDPVGFNRHALERTVEGMALTFVVSTQLLEHMVRDGKLSTPQAI
jgi:asparagine synthase (glutamine-hydrolysing)